MAKTEVIVCPCTTDNRCSVSGGDYGNCSRCPTAISFLIRKAAEVGLSGKAYFVSAEHTVELQIDAFPEESNKTAYFRLKDGHYSHWTERKTDQVT